MYTRANNVPYASRTTPGHESATPKVPHLSNIRVFYTPPAPVILDENI